jgi:hypothetical protein
VVADSAELAMLGWKPELNDLQTMIEHAWRWEKILAASGSGSRRADASEAATESLAVS